MLNDIGDYRFESTPMEPLHVLKRRNWSGQGFEMKNHYVFTFLDSIHLKKLKYKKIKGTNQCKWKIGIKD